MSCFICHGVGLVMAAAVDGVVAAGGLDADVREQQVGVDLHRRDVRDVDRLLELAEPLRREVHDGGRRDLHLRRGTGGCPGSAGWRRRRGRRDAPRLAQQQPPRDGEQPARRARRRSSRDPWRVTLHTAAPACQAARALGVHSRVDLKEPHRASSCARRVRRPQGPLPLRQAHQVLPPARQSPTSARSSTTDFRRSTRARLSEACHIFSDKMLAPENDTTIGLTVAGALTPAGLGGCLIEMMERGLVDFVISTGANLYHDLHYALNFTLRRGSPFLDDRELYDEGVIRIYDVLFPATVLLETDAYIRDFLVRSRHRRAGLDLGVPLPARPGSAERAARAARTTRCVARGRQVRRADLHLVARRQLDRHERRLARADERQPADDRPEQGRQRGLRHHPGRARRTAA